MKLVDAVVNDILKVDKLQSLMRGEEVDKMQGMLNGQVVGEIDTYSKDYKNNQYRTDLNDDLFKKLVWVYKSILKVAENVAAVPKKVYQVKADGTKEDISTREEFTILYKPNPFQTGYDFWMESVVRLLLQGELFWEKGRLNNGKIVQLFADWRSEEIKILPDPEYMIKGFVRTINNHDYSYEKSEVFYMKFLDPTDQLRGFPPLQAGRDATILDIDAISYNRKVFSEGFSAKGILDAPNLRSDKEAEAIRQRMKKLYSGKAGEQIAVVYGGAKFTALNNLSMRDAQFLELRKYNREEILAIFGVPPALVGIFETAIRANAEEQRKTFWQETIIPLMNKILSTISVFLLPELSKLPNIVFEADYSKIDVLKEDLNNKTKRYMEGFAKAAVTPNDIRVDILGKEAIDSPLMNTTYLPFNIVPTDPKVEMQLPNAAPAEGKAYKFQTKLPVKTRDFLWTKVISLQNPYEQKMLKLMRKLFNAQKKEVIKIIEENFEKAVTKRIPEITELLEEVFAVKWVEIFEEACGPLYKETMTAGGLLTNELSEMNIMDLLDPVVEAELGKFTYKLAEGINETTYKQIVEQLRRGLAEDEGLAEITKRIFNIYNKAGKSRAATIARTETMNALNFGQLKAGELAEDLPNKMWLTSRDGKVRDSHQIDGQVVRKAEDFTLADGDTMPYPMDINERCTMLMTKEEET